MPQPSASPVGEFGSLAAAAATTPLLLLGRRPDPDTERGVVCPGVVPDPADPGLVVRARTARAALGNQAVVLGHHYQRDEVIQFADATGDSFKLARDAASHTETHGAAYVVFCGVHFMAESADILTPDTTTVVLPDLAAGCSLADMAEISQVEGAWVDLEEAGCASVVPLTYMNSSAAIKAFTGRHGGTVCTSSNAEVAMRWAFAQGQQVLFLPDQHLGRNTAVLQLGLSLDDCVVYDPNLPSGGLTAERLRSASVVLWKGHCSVHGTFLPAHVELARAKVGDVRILVHPECRHDVVTKADLVGSTEFIIRAVREAPAGTAWAIGTELNLVGRLAQEHPEQTITYLNEKVCFCSTMNRIDLPHLVWALESLAAGEIVNPIRVDPGTASWARVALDRMLALPAA